MTFTILLSAAGRRLSLLRSLREAVEAAGLRGRIIACDLDRTAPAMHAADAGFIVPRCTDPRFIPAVTRLCRRERVDLVVPTIDTELPVWAGLRRELADSGTRVAVSDPATIAIAADKRLTNAHCVSVGVPCPRQASLTDLLTDRTGWTPPLVIKPVAGSASAGLRHAASWAEFDRVADGANAERGNLVVEQRARGTEYTVDVYVDRAGVVRCPVVRRRIEVRAGEVSKAQVVHGGHLASLAVKAVETLPGAYGVLNVQLFSDGQEASLIEINARFGGGYPLTWRAGGRYGEWLVREVAYGEPPPPDPAIAYGLMMLRWDDEVFVRAR